VKALVVLLAGLTLVAPALASEQHPTQSELEAELACPTCRTPLDESSSPIAQQMKAHIRRWIAQGWTKSEIEDEFVRQLGPEVLGVPRTHGFDLLAWVLPLAGIAVGAAALAAGAWHWSHSREEAEDAGAAAGASSPLEPEVERRVDEALARFDA
jgi:cytochrome c-type biogenesis protein CcmH